MEPDPKDNPDAQTGNRRDRPNLLSRMRENVSWLESSAKAFDEGYESEAKRLAVSLRVVLHDTAGSKSILGQLDIKDNMAFTDTSEPMSQFSLSASGLVIMRLNPRDRSGSYVAPLSMLSPPRVRPPICFTPWWANTVYVDSEQVIWTRKKFVLMLANAEGGAHVDPKLNAAYERLVTANGLGWTANTADGPEPFTGSPAAASVRQITYELLDTLKRHPDLLS